MSLSSAATDFVVSDGRRSENIRVKLVFRVVAVVWLGEHEYLTVFLPCQVRLHLELLVLLLVSLDQLLQFLLVRESLLGKALDEKRAQTSSTRASERNNHDAGATYPTCASRDQHRPHPVRAISLELRKKKNILTMTPKSSLIMRW